MGDNHLGGDDFDERLLDYVIKTFKKETKVNLAKDITASQRVRRLVRMPRRSSHLRRLHTSICHLYRQ